MAEDDARALYEPLTDEALARLDQQYQPFPEFDVWKNVEVDTERWERLTLILREQRELSNPNAVERASAVVTRAAAFDTGALEGLYSTDRGFTLTIARSAARWEQAIDTRGATTRGLFEAHLNAYELVLDAAFGEQPMTEAWIRRLHEDICAPQATYVVRLPDGKVGQRELQKGQYKTEPNHVQQQDGTDHAYAPVDDTPSEMHRLVQVAASPEFSAAHPIIQSAFLHYALVCVHPFADGNGRVARALASLPTFKALSLPILILLADRDRYLEALERADGGDLGSFVTFVGERVFDAITLALDSLHAIEAPDAAGVAREFADLLRVQGGVTHADRDEQAYRLLELIGNEFNLQVSALSLPRGVTAGADLQEAGDPPAREGYQPRVMNRAHRMLLRLASEPPAAAEQSTPIYTVVAGSRSNPFAYRVIAPDYIDIEVRLEEVYPQPSEALRLRLANLLGPILGDLLQKLLYDAAATLRGAGYEAPDEGAGA
jgi:Fic family protein